MTNFDKALKKYKKENPNINQMEIQAFRNGWSAGIQWVMKHACINETDSHSGEKWSYSGGYIRDENYVEVCKQSILKGITE